MVPHRPTLSKSGGQVPPAVCAGSTNSMPLSAGKWGSESIKTNKRVVVTSTDLNHKERLQKSDRYS